MIDFMSIQALHEQVRTFVEKEEPTYKVVRIDEDTRSEYVPPLAQQYELHPANVEYRLLHIIPRFRVQAVRPGMMGKQMNCEVQVKSNDIMQITRRVYEEKWQ